MGIALPPTPPQAPPIMRGSRRIMPMAHCLARSARETAPEACNGLDLQNCPSQREVPGGRLTRVKTPR
jgi:hypothetical protein